MKTADKQEEYTVKIMEAISDELFQDEDFLAELEDEENGLAFIHAISNLVPAVVYKQLTGEDVDLLGFNHIANRLCFQFSNQTIKE